MKLFQYIFLLTLALPIGLYSQVVINEACSDNETVLIDEFGNFPDWIELYNPTTDIIDLTGYFLSDESAELQKWQFPTFTINPGEFTIIYTSDLDLCDVNCHTNFKLSSDGEGIYLSNTLGENISELIVPSLVEDQSYGYISESSSEFAFFSIPTPGSSNDNGSGVQQTISPSFNTSQYFYKDPTTIEILCADINAKIYYTLDGKTPSETSAEYLSPISIDTTTALLAVAIANNKIPSYTIAKTFFIGTNHSLPIMSIVSEPDNFWSFENGIFEFGPDADSIYPYYGANFWKDLEIPLHIDYYVDHELALSQEISSKIHGGKAARNNNMKALRLITDGDVPSDGMNYQFFDNKDIDTYRRIVMRNASGDYNYTHFRDAYLHRYFTDEELDIDVLSDQPIVAYINGIYWGVMHLREKIDRFYIKENYGYSRSEIDILEEDLFIIEGDSAEYVSNYNFLVNNDLSIETNYEQAAEMFDVYSLVDFWIAQSFVNNTDFPSNNIKFWQPKEEGGKWRYLLFDLDVGMGRHGWTQAFDDNFSTKLENPSNIKFINIILAFYENQGFREYFLNRYCDLMNTTFREELFLEETKAAANELDREMVDHFNTWGWPGYDAWLNDRLPRLYSFVEDRPVHQRKFVQDYFGIENDVLLELNVYPPNAGSIRINTVDVPSLPWDGHYYNGVPVEITVSENPGYEFSYWKALYKQLDNTGNKRIQINFEEDDQLTAFFNNPGETSQELELHTNHPQGTNDILLTFTLDRETDIVVQVYTIAGALVRTYDLGRMNGGKQQETIELPELISGVYIVKIQSETNFASDKFIYFN